MTVQELIDELLKIADKQQQVLDREYFPISTIEQLYPLIILK